MQSSSECAHVPRQIWSNYRGCIHVSPLTSKDYTGKSQFCERGHVYDPPTKRPSPVARDRSAPRQTRIFDLPTGVPPDNKVQRDSDDFGVVYTGM